MTQQWIKHIPAAKPQVLADLVDYQTGRIVSLTLAQQEQVSLTVFAFSQGEGVSTHSAPGDALVYMLDGEAEIMVGDEKILAVTGETVLMPANIPHGLQAVADFKMLLILVKGA